MADFKDSIAIFGLVLGLFLGGLVRFRDARFARRQDPLNPLGRVESRVDELQRRSETPEQAEARRNFEVWIDRQLLWVRPLMVVLIIGSTSWLIYSFS